MQRLRIVPIILSGGSGTRLWPLSRAGKPKQFLSLAGGRALIQETALRCRAEIFDPSPIIVGADAHRFHIAEAMAEIGVAAEILLEPVARNTCAAIVAGCLAARARDAGAMVLVLAADHFIPDVQAFTAAVAEAAAAAAGGLLVTFGVKPAYPATGYGYIAPGATLQGKCRAVDAFIEKPGAAEAARYVEAGCLWNSGNFLFGAAAFLAEAAALAPEVYAAAAAAHQAARRDLDFLRLDRAAYESAPSISVDHAVMEKTRRAAVLPVGYAWSDIGSWDAMADLSATDPDGNAVIGDGVVRGGRNNFIHSEGTLAAVLGLDGVAVVTTRDAVLVTARRRGEDVKALVAQLAAQGHPAAREALQVFRPWGNYERLDAAPGYQVKRLTVNPGAILSLQEHVHRSEHWVVVSGEVTVTIGSEERLLRANQSAYIPAGTRHRLANRGTLPAVLIEVQTGSYLGEDDILRHEDIYNRGGREGPET